MAEAWRIVKTSHAASAFSGHGAAAFGGRWNSPGVKIIYASATKSLATLENLVHLNPKVVFKYVSFRVEFEDSLAEKLMAPPTDWTSEPPSTSTQKIGDAWVHSNRSAILIVPSIIVPGELNFLLNPVHPDFKKIRIGKPEAFTFDPRLL
jgi:RES domain-containing protein